MIASCPASQTRSSMSSAEAAADLHRRGDAGPVRRDGERQRGVVGADDLPRRDPAGAETHQVNHRPRGDPAALGNGVTNRDPRVNTADAAVDDTVDLGVAQIPLGERQGRLPG
jgi:hypothetical protein